MFSDVKRVLKRCEICQKAKSSALPSPPIKPIEVSRRNEILSLDLYGPLPKSKGGVRYLCVGVDLFTKHLALYPLKKATTSAILNRLIKNYFPEFGKPEKILTDQGSQFKSKKWIDTLREHDVKTIFTSVRHPQANPVERYMRELSRLFRTYCYNKHTAWANYVKRFGDIMNSVVHESTGFTPRELHLGKPPVSLVREVCNYPVAEGLLHEQRLFLAKASLEGKAARRALCNPGRPYRHFREGDLVLLRANNTSSSIDAETKKLLLLFEGPFKIKKQVRDATYVLEGLDTKKERGIFHASHLKLYHPSEE